MSPKYTPPDKNEITALYDNKLPAYSFLIDEIVSCLSKAISDSDIVISSIESRIKQFDSVYYKCIQLKLSSNNFEKIDDIAGVRIICLYRDDLSRIGDIISKNFIIHKCKLFSKQPESVFGYMSDHYVVKLPLQYNDSKYDSVNELKCEIQVRTVSMHAWALVSHHLDYKKEMDIPSTLKKDFNALSGIFYVADTLFDQFRRSRNMVITKLKEDLYEDFNLTMEINYDSLDAYISWKLPDRYSKESLIYTDHLSNLLQEINESSYNNLKELDMTINENMNWLLNEENKYIKENKIPKKTIYKGIGVIREILKKKHPETYRDK